MRMKSLEFQKGTLKNQKTLSIEVNCFKYNEDKKIEGDLDAEVEEPEIDF